MQAGTPIHRGETIWTARYATMNQRQTDAFFRTRMNPVSLAGISVE
jgi:hypothetical protein